MSGKVNILVGGQYGSEGKGVVSAYLSDRYDIHVRVGSHNAGHTFYWKGDKHVMQSIPCGWINPNAIIVLGAGSLLNMNQLEKEIAHIEKYYPDFRERLRIDSRAGILEDRFMKEEGGTEGEMHRRIGSTGEGVGPARMARIARDPSNFRRFRDVAEEYGLGDCIATDTAEFLYTMNRRGSNILVEGTQGSALSLIHSYWPYCTSIDTNASGIASEVGLPPSSITDVTMVCRTYPIRVAGNSGPMMNEISWDVLSDRIGKSILPERTTVTHKVRRIAEWDPVLFRHSLILNRPTSIALTFCDYVDPSVYGTELAYDEGGLFNSSLINEFMSRSHLLGGYRYDDMLKFNLFSTGEKSMVEYEVKR